MRIIGIDLAWGERNGDGLCLIEAADPVHARAAEFAHVFGDAALLAWIEARTPPGEDALLLFDAPVICPNVAGSRPVDRLTHTLFGKFHAGAHPANATRCGRPLRLVKRLEARGYATGWQLSPGARLATEVFPHPAMVRWFGLERIVKYKRGPLPARRAEFSRLQDLLTAWLHRELPALFWTPALSAVLAARWTKPAEDQIDALVCALVGLWHWKFAGRRSEVIGDAQTGFILLPAAASGSAL